MLWPCTIILVYESLLGIQKATANRLIVVIAEVRCVDVRIEQKQGQKVGVAIS
jgi:hypothetical protein